MDYKLITEYFPDLTPQQQQQFAALGPCYQSWNARINLISRKDMDQFYLRHVLHSLSMAKYFSFPVGAYVLDLGTGGGFPGIPLAILFPQTQFFLCDSIAKKILAVNDIAARVGLKNVSASQIRAENIQQRFDFVVSRAVAPLSQLIFWVWDKTDQGMMCLKGGNLDKELIDSAQLLGIPPCQIKEVHISQWFSHPFFEEKKMVCLCK
ncbi:MAG: 16S rRNA (guanine(527)-N(7))-methyltransferase RsmG [Bacteroidales bacterium]|nr:16S rRNA (guanine(527)-N(7))-methyltransferase RsmG [Bacteroidales bacterium]MCL2738777.1 16S rRNA (guanine(527)-N(7))-methyltransferase RsmG [Bacteroidales bacterium]